MVDCFYFNIFLLMDMLDIDSLVDSLIHRLSGHILELFGATPTCSTLNYWLFSHCQLQGQIDWHAFGLKTNQSCVWSQADLRAYSKQIFPACCVLQTLSHFCVNSQWSLLTNTYTVFKFPIFFLYWWDEAICVSQSHKLECLHRWVKFYK